METVHIVILAVFALLVAAAVAFVLCRAGYKEKVFRVAYRFVCEAEEQITGTKRGQARKAAVVAKLHTWLPAWARFFISEKDIDALIELAVVEMKKALANELAEIETAAENE